jgi:hypothetical protein
MRASLPLDAAHETSMPAPRGRIPGCSGGQRGAAMADLPQLLPHGQAMGGLPHMVAGRANVRVEPSRVGGWRGSCWLGCTPGLIHRLSAEGRRTVSDA